MSDDNPFGEPDETEKTVIRPSPGGRRPAPAERTMAPDTGREAPPPPSDPNVAAVLTRDGLNPVVAAASVLLGLASRIRGTATQRDIEGLRDRVVRELKSFEANASATGLPRELVRTAHYALSATIDDLVLSTPWGGQSSWAKRSMVSTFHNEVVGGERFYEILSQLHKNPGRSADVLELMYVCLALGFEGRLRVTGRGTSEHSRVRESIYRTLRERQGDFERELSPHWRGLAAVHRPLTSYIPVWVIAVVTAAVLMLMFMGFTYALSDASDTSGVLADLQPVGVVGLFRQQPAPPPPPPVLEPNVFTKFLEPEIKEGLVTVEENAQRILVRISGEGMFESGSDKLNKKFVPIMERIGKALQTQPGNAVITGHTDNVPIKTLRFPSNYELSLARAETVKAIVASFLSDPSRVTSEGHGETEPVVDNKTPENRRKNRRIELVVDKPEAAEAATAAAAQPGTTQ
jgi:type VI secretion system protein ImpK